MNSSDAIAIAGTDERLAVGGVFTSDDRGSRHGYGVVTVHREGGGR